ncbi:MAG TPA: PQQ-dependent sugar dehydrogenase [Bryobacteraceae bacterium]|nr:PQQ-dependent sugar dehydrogenase [Bryobacteraceae bacterium]
MQILLLTALSITALAAPRSPWTASRVIGSPEPPSPYRTQRAFPHLDLERPTVITSAPGTDRFFVALIDGRIVSFANTPHVSSVELFLDANVNLSPNARDPRGGPVRRTISGLTFHPDYAKNGYLYVFITEAWPPPRRTRIARFTRDPANPLRARAESEQIVLEFPSDGHNGGPLKFGADGYLYIGTGDAFGQNDPMHTGQFLGDLLASILRIDVNGTHSVKPYRIPPDNPFLNFAGAMPEIWAFGFRQPWKMSFDRKTGDLWVGEVGQDLWESVYRVQRGGNYGWSVNEGPQTFRQDRPRGPGPILKPAVAHSHAEARSITGGFVYRGTRLKELNGAYIYGDWETGKIWGLRHDGVKQTWHQELDDTELDIVDFAEDHSGELYLMTHNDGRLYRLMPREKDPAADRSRTFPRLLSQTGVFSSTKDHLPAAGLVPYEVNAALWSDGADKTRFIAIPGDGKIEIVNNSRWNFPVGTVLVKTFTLGGRRLETRLLTLQPSATTREQWAGYVYVWNDAQTDAELIGRDSLEKTYKLPNGTTQTWQFPSRTDCMICHNEKAGFALGVNTWQMNRGGQLRQLADASLFSKPLAGNLPSLPDPYNAKAGSLDQRARSYLHSNCAHCHQPGAGGNAEIRLLYNTALSDTRLVDVEPSHGGMDVAGARLIAPGDPNHSVIFLRTATRASGKMPHVGTLKVDDQAVALLKEWIVSLKK